jgi:RNA polymerase II elongation factor ELL
LYQSSADDGLEFAGLVSHNLAVQKAEDVTAGVDTAVEQLRNNMAAISEFREANKYVLCIAASCWYSD